MSHPSVFLLLPTPCLLPGGALGRLPSLPLNPGLFNAAGFGGLLFTKTPQSVFFFRTVDAPPGFFNVSAQGLSGIILLLHCAAKGRVTQVHVVLVAGVLPVPFDPVDVAELAATALAVNDWLTLFTVVYLGCATAEWAPYHVGDPQGDVFDEQTLVSKFAE